MPKIDHDEHFCSEKKKSVKQIISGALNLLIFNPQTIILLFPTDYQKTRQDLENEIIIAITQHTEKINTFFIKINLNKFSSVVHLM